MSKEYTTELLIDFGDDGQKLLPVVTQNCATKEEIGRASCRERV